MKESYIEFMKETLKIEPLDPSAKTKDKQELRCLLCEETFVSVPADRKMKHSKI